MSTEVATVQPTDTAIIITEDQRELVKKTVAQDATDAELQLYFYDCKRRGVHPLDKLLHFTKRSGKYTPVTSIDLFRMRADQTGLHLGTDEPMYSGSKGTPDFSATVKVYKLVAGQKVSFSATARWSEYYPGDQQGFMWKKMPHLMLGKCAEALALRKAFPAQLHGLYVQEEMDQAEAKPLPAFVPHDDTRQVPTAADEDVPPEGQFIWRLGKWKGTPIDEIPLSYLEWFAKEGKVGDHKEAAQKALDWARAQQSLNVEDAEDGFAE